MSLYTQIYKKNLSIAAKAAIGGGFRRQGKLRSNEQESYFGSVFS